MTRHANVGPCEAPNSDHHSSDRYTVFVGDARGYQLCGYHSQAHTVGAIVREIREAEGR